MMYITRFLTFLVTGLYRVLIFLMEMYNRSLMLLEIKSSLRFPSYTKLDSEIYNNVNKGLLFILYRYIQISQTNTHK